MAKLHIHELDYGQITREIIFGWCPLLAAWLFYEFRHPWCDGIRSFIESNGLAPLMPQAKNAGLGPLSFISTATGLNLVIVKFQTFLKSQEDSQNRWAIEGIKKAIDNRPELNVDEPTSERFKQAVQERSKKYVAEINATNLKRWAMWNRWAVRVTVIGIACLIFNYSAGFLIPFMLAPVIATWVLGRSTSEYLFTKIDTVCEMAADFVTRLKEESGRTGSAVSKQMKEAATPELPLKPKKNGNR